MPRPVIYDPTGKRFGRLIAIKLHSHIGRIRLFECLCDCGKISFVNAMHLKNGATKSCGCYRKENSSTMNTIHGYSRTKEYHSWCDMRSRCLDKTNSHYESYGGRGITICDRWLNSFETFLLDMGKRPPNYTLDRKDVNGNYESNNCRWATDRQQYFNKTTTRYITERGVTLPVTKWAEIMGVKPRLLFCRLYGNFKLGLDKIPMDKITQYLEKDAA